MTQINSISFKGNSKFSNYDVKQAEKIAVLSMVGDKEGAKSAFRELYEDKKYDKIRNIIISIGALAGTIALRKSVGGKITKFMSNAGDIIANWFRKSAGDGKKVVSEFLDKKFEIGAKIKPVVKKVLHKLLPDNDHYQGAVNFLRKNTDKIKNLKILKPFHVKSFRDIAELGATTAVGLKVDNPINRFVDRADEGIDENRKIASEGV